MIVAEARLEVTAVAVRVTVGEFGTAAGALYVMGTPELLDVAERVPQVMPLQPTPLSDQRIL